MDMVALRHQGEVDMLEDGDMDMEAMMEDTKLLSTLETETGLKMETMKSVLAKTLRLARVSETTTELVGAISSLWAIILLEVMVL